MSVCMCIHVYVMMMMHVCMYAFMSIYDKLARLIDCAKQLRRSDDVLMPSCVCVFVCMCIRVCVFVCVCVNCVCMHMLICLSGPLCEANHSDQTMY